jgi:hypothetical protein
MPEIPDPGAAVDVSVTGQVRPRAQQPLQPGRLRIVELEHLPQRGQRRAMHPGPDQFLQARMPERDRKLQHIR